MNVRFGPTTSTPRRASVLAVRVEEPRRAVQPDRGLAGAGPALDHERRRPGRAVIRRYWSAWIVATMSRMCCVAVALELLEQEVADRRAVDDRAVERLVGDVEQPAAVGAEAPAQRDAVRVVRRRRVERPCRRRLPVDDELLLLLVVHPAAADVERPRRSLEVEPPEAEAALGVLERASRWPPTRRSPPARPRRRRVAGAARRPRACARVRVGAVDVRLLGLQIRMAHRST